MMAAISLGIIIGAALAMYSRPSKEQMARYYAEYVGLPMEGAQNGANGVADSSLWTGR